MKSWKENETTSPKANVQDAEKREIEIHRTTKPLFKKHRPEFYSFVHSKFMMFVQSKIFNLLKYSHGVFKCKASLSLICWLLWMGDDGCLVVGWMDSLVGSFTLNGMRRKWRVHTLRKGFWIVCISKNVVYEPHTLNFFETRVLFYNFSCLRNKFHIGSTISNS